MKSNTSLVTKILIEMCRRVKTEYRNINFSSKDWYLTHNWSMEDQDAFKYWLISFLLKEGYTKSNLLAEREANTFILSYGWQTTVH